MNDKTKKIVFLTAGIVLSCTLLYSLSISPLLTEHTISSIMEKKETVLKLTAAISGIVLVLSFIPGNAASSVASAFTNLTGYLLIITAALFLEKYMVTLTGLLAFRALIPLALLLCLIDVWKEQIRFREMAKRLILFALCLYALVPSTMFIADLFQNTYDQSVQSALYAETEIEEEEEPEATAEPEMEEKEDKGLLDTLSDGWKSFTTSAKQVVESVSELPEAARNKVEEISMKFDLFVESIAIMVVTTCFLPILVFFLFSWLMKLFFNVHVPMPKKLPKLNDEVKKLKQKNSETKQIEHKEETL